MPSFTIHIAIAKEYIKKHELEIKDKEQFIKGNIMPDLEEDMTQIIKDKNKTHYGKWDKDSNIIHIKSFFQDKQVDLTKEYWKGYLLHLITDDFFANIVFKKETLQIKECKDTFYHDYSCLNKILMEKYEITPLENIKKYMEPLPEESRYLKPEKIIKFIDKMSSVNLENVAKRKKKKEEEYNR